MTRFLSLVLTIVVFLAGALVGAGMFYLPPPGDRWWLLPGALVGPDGALYLSDDRAGAVYRIWFPDRQ